MRGTVHAPQCSTHIPSAPCANVVSMLGYKLVERVTAVQRAYDYVKSQILTAQLPGGALISENSLAAELGMSRTPVRSAFQRLQTEGWLTLYPKRGAVVTPSSPLEAQHVLDVRHLIEVHAVRSTEQSQRPEMERQLVRIIGLQHDCAQADNDTEFARLDTAFHRHIVAAARNSILVEIYDTLRERQQRMTVTVLARSPETIRAILTGHTELARLAAAGDVTRFAAALHHHLSVVHGVSLPHATRVGHMPWGEA